MWQLKRQGCCLQHWRRRRRRLLSFMIGVCIITTLLSVIYFLFFYHSSSVAPSLSFGARSSLNSGFPSHGSIKDYFPDRNQHQGDGSVEEDVQIATVTTSGNRGDFYDNLYEEPVYYHSTVNKSFIFTYQASKERFPQYKKLKALYLLRTNFVKEKLDVLSRTGDESDYLFHPCQSDDASQLNDIYGFLGPFRYLANYKNPCWMEPGSGDMPTVMCVPYFYLVGAPKAGSTDLYKRITMHPEVVSPLTKETRWFDRKRFLKKPHFSSFLSNFVPASGVISRSLEKDTNYHRRIVGDGSPSYFFDNRNWPLMLGNEGCEEPRVTVASHIHHLFPEARIIFIFRNPVDRLYSSYLYNHAKYETLNSGTFDVYARQAVKVYKDCFARYTLRACANNVTLFHEANVMLIVSLYSVFVQDWMKLFPRQQLLFITTEQYNRDMDTYLRKIYDFLGLRKLTWDEMEGIRMHSAYNKGPHYHKTGPMLKQTRDLLEEFFRPYNQQLANMLNDPEFLWMS